MNASELSIFTRNILGSDATVYDGERFYNILIDNDYSVEIDDDNVYLSKDGNILSETDYENKIVPMMSMLDDDTMLMNPVTGSVATESEWREDFEKMSSEEWGGEEFEDAGLVEVVRDESGNWVEA